MAKFKLKPGEIEAVQFDGENWVEMISFTGTRKDDDGEVLPVFRPVSMTMFAVLNPDLVGAKAALWVENKDYIVYVKPGDWVVKGTHILSQKTGFHLMKDEVFQELYERIE